MKIKLKSIISVCLCLCLSVTCLLVGNKRIEVKDTVRAESQKTEASYFTVYDYDDPDKVVLVKGEGVDVNDEYLSSDNKLWRIVEVNYKTKTGKAEFLGTEELPKYSVKRKKANVASAKSNKKVGIYHTHNDESYVVGDGYDSVYGKGGIHDVGAKLKKDFQNLGMEVIYSENLHLPHNSGAYSRSQMTAAEILDQGVDAIFDVHRDATPRDYYLTKVDGEQMTSIRMVVGTGNQNYYENREFAYSIKAYADDVYPGLIKDIYMGKGNYNQQLTNRAMLFEFGSDQVEKELVLKATTPLTKTLDVVLYGSNNASETSLDDVELVSSTDGSASVITGLVDQKKTASVSFIWILLASIAFYFIVLGIVCIFSKQARHKTKRFFQELFAIRKQ